MMRTAMQSDDNYFSIVGTTPLTAALASSSYASLLHACSSTEFYPIPAGDGEEMHYTPEATTFSLWSPVADEVCVRLYDAGEGGQLLAVVPLQQGEDGTWQAVVRCDLLGQFYTFQVRVYHQWLHETPGIRARAVGVNGRRGAIIDWQTTHPEGWEQDVRPPLLAPADMILYEMHHRDFSASPSAGVRSPGKFVALTERGTCNAAREATGIDHLVELGVTHVHLLPSFDFASVDEAHPENQAYNWGYDPLNYWVPEGSYATDPFRPEVRIREYKQMVMALHRAGIRVVMDVVFNHTYHTQDSYFENTVPVYFYRHRRDGSFANASGCGNETASERPMMRKFMVDTVLYWMREYHVDGFRFDLMGIHDVETMNAIRRAVDEVDPSVCIYGEGWAAGVPSYPVKRLAMKANVARMPGIAAFSDEFRDALAGPVGDVRQGGFLAAVPGQEMSVKFGIVGGIAHPQLSFRSVNYVSKPWATLPTQVIGYVSCHDGWCLMDRLKAAGLRMNQEQLIRLHKLAHAMVLTSQCIPLILAGEEFIRDKQGDANSYRSSDAVNAIDWDRKTVYADVMTYFRRLIRLRKLHPAFRMGSAEKVRKHLEFLPVKGSNLVAYRLKAHANGDAWEDIVVAFNARLSPARLTVPFGTYTIIAEDGVIDLRGLGVHTGNEIIVPGQSVWMMYR